MVIPRLVGQALRNEPLTVYGDGSQTRTFTYVADVVRSLMGLMDSEKSVGEVFNIGGKGEISIPGPGHENHQNGRILIPHRPDPI